MDGGQAIEGKAALQLSLLDQQPLRERCISVRSGMDGLIWHSASLVTADFKVF